MQGGMPRPVAFDGASGNKLRGDAFGDPNARPIILLHGGGQTRHSWSDTATILAEDGWQVVNLDQRGHGDSDWSKDGEYSSADYAADLVALDPQLPARPVFVGASLGGIAALMAEGLHDALRSREGAALETLVSQSVLMTAGKMHLFSQPSPPAPRR